MDIELSKAAIEYIGVEPLMKYGVTKDWLKYGSSYTFHMMDMTKKAARDFHGMIASIKSEDRKLERHFRSREIEAADWLKILENKTTKLKKVEQFEDALKLVLKDAPKHWIYQKDEVVDAWQPYFVDEITYVPKKYDRVGNLIDEENVVIRLCYEEFSKYRTASQRFSKEDIVHHDPVSSMAKLGYKMETPELLAAYTEQTERFARMYSSIGLQCEAVGRMEIETVKKGNGWWSRVEKHITMDRDGVPGRVVIDIYKEGDDDGKSGKGERPCVSFWDKQPVDHEGSEDDDDCDIRPGDEDPEEDQFAKTLLDYSIPVMPSVKLFDLRRHHRVTGRIEQLTEYQYQEGLHEKLILPKENKDLIDIMIGSHGGFADIIGNKGHGTIILVDGPPGTGKTLTAEVVCEAMRKPLYSVQCSQIGLNSDEIEEELLKVLARAQRWNAILLMDEADVYVMKRGSDLAQNAIVGVFLRVLEYYRGIMFLTTNRGDDVDDAIASRCLARIGYTNPSMDDQKRIWKTLSETSGVKIADGEIDKIVKAFENLSGRDVKNLLKLAGIVSVARGKDADYEMVKYVKRFKPTE